MPDLLIATQNRGKLEEIKSVLQPSHSNLRIRELSGLRDIPKIEEDGSSFLQNAQKKAKMIASFTRIPTLADDSGLEVDALGGRPGILSARFAGPQATDEENIRKLLEKLKGVPPEKRTARFRCVMVLYAANGHSFTATGDLSGRVTETPRGTGGFGYDPIFLVPELGHTLAEITLTEKNRISHRALALTKISSHLNEFLQQANR